MRCEAARRPRAGACEVKRRAFTPEMAVRVMTAIDERLAVVLQVAEAIAQADPSTYRSVLVESGSRLPGHSPVAMP